MKNKKLCLAIVILCVMALMTTGIIAIVYIQNDRYKSETNDRLMAMLQLMYKENPDMDIKDAVDVLNSADNAHIDDELKQYGTDIEEDFAIKKLDNIVYESIKYIAIIVLVTTCLLVIIWIIYCRSNSKEVDEIIDYIDRIHNRDYTLSLKDNSEDDLSRLKNELYKIVVMLKEQSDNSNIEREKLSKLVADISHQIKTPLTSISIMLDNIIDDPDMNIEVRDRFVTEITRQIEWVNWLVISLLKLAKFDAGVVQFEVERIDVNSLLKDCVNNLFVSCNVYGVNIVLEGDEKTAYEGDYKWQLEAFINIIKNCIEHSHKGGKVYVDYSTNNLFTKITIRDEGTGMSSDEVRHVFERFYRGKNASENSIGIGLALSKTIIERDGGYITCESEEGVGTTFTIKYQKG